MGLDAIETQSAEDCRDFNETNKFASFSRPSHILLRSMCRAVQTECNDLTLSTGVAAIRAHNQIVPVGLFTHTARHLPEQVSGVCFQS